MEIRVRARAAMIQEVMKAMAMTKKSE